MKLALSLTSFVASSLLLPASTDAQAAFTLTVAHMNDHHSHVAEESFEIGAADLPEGVTLPPPPEGEDPYDEVSVTYGGFPRLVSMYKSVTGAAGPDTNLLTLHAGDAMVGTLYHKVSEGKADSEMMNFVCFDAMTLGNHEFDFGDTFLASFITDLQAGPCDVPTAVLSANFVSEISPVKDLIEPVSKFTFANGEVVAVIGLTPANTASSSFADEGSSFAGIIETAQAQIAAATAEGVDKIVLLTHVGIDEDMILSQLEGVDILVGGHTHSLLGDPMLFAGNKNARGSYPTVEMKETPTGMVCIVQAWEYGHAWGLLTVDFDAAGIVTKCTGGPKFPIDGLSYSPELDANSTAILTAHLESLGSYVAVEPDAATAAALAVWTVEVDIFGMQVLVNVPEPGICFDRIPGQGRGELCSPEQTAAQGGGACNIVAQAFMLQVPNGDIAIQNGGGCRTDISPGDFTTSDAFAMLPFENTLVTLVMTGSQIVQVLNEALASSSATGNSTGAYPYAAGLRFDVDIMQEFGSYLSNVEVNPRNEGDWMPIDLMASYTVVTNSFISSGRDGYIEFSKVPTELITETYLEYGLSFVEWLDGQETLVDLPSDLYSTQSYIGTQAPIMMDTAAPIVAPITGTMAPATVAPVTVAPVTGTMAPATVAPVTVAPGMPPTSGTSSNVAVVACAVITVFASLAV
jgi:5'-nucleotidase/UDP-sugar diphosphatase